MLSPTAAHKSRRALWTVARLWRNGKWDSAPFFVALAAFVFIQVVRFAGGELRQGVTLVLICAIMACIFAASRSLDGGEVVVLKWSACIGAAMGWMVYGLYAGFWIPFFSGIPLACLLGIPYWQHLYSLRNPQKQHIEYVPAPPVAPTEAFPGVSWLRGAQPGVSVTTRSGRMMELTLPPGKDVRKFVDGNAVSMAGVLEVASDAVELVEGATANKVMVYTHTTDTLSEPIPWQPPSSPSILDPVPLGINRANEPVCLSLSEKHLLIGGESGSGKNKAIDIIAATAALDPSCKLWLLDRKGTELSKWAPVSEAYATTVDEGLAVLRAVTAEVQARNAAMRAAGARSARVAGIGPGLLVVDELASYTLDAKPEQRTEFFGMLLNLLNVARSVDVMVVAATQRPSANLISGDLRAGFTYRFALRTSDRNGSKMILDTVHPDASKISSAKRGLGYLMEGGGQPRLMRTFLATDEQIDLLAVEAQRVRGVVKPALQLVSSVKLTEPAVERPVVEYKCPVFPDGSPVPVHRVALWEAVQAHPGAIAGDLAAAAGLSRTKVSEVLKKWAEAGYVHPQADGRATKYLAAV